jgi:hypothetical protein
MMSPAVQDDFSEIAELIEIARQKSYQAVNTALIELYWQVGAYIVTKSLPLNGEMLSLNN